MELYAGFLAIAFAVICNAESLRRVERSNENWIVTTLEEKPYVIKKAPNPRSNDDFEGFVPDMMKRIGEKLNQKYTLELVRDGRYGVQVSGRWSGMIGEVIDGRAELAAAPITISDERDRVVDFTEPFLTFGTQIMFHKQNGSAPTTLKEFLQKQGVKFGVIRDGTTEQLIRNSNDPDLGELRNKIEHLDSQEDGVKKVREAKDGKYAFVIEEYTAQYWTHKKDCDLDTINISQLQPRNYAFALKANSPLTEKVSKAIRELKESGEVDKMRSDWWKNECSGAAKGSYAGVYQTATMIATTILISMMSFTY